MSNEKALLSKAAERIGTLTVERDWQDIQLASLQQALEAVTLDRDQIHTKYGELQTERNALAARVRELEPPPATGPTRKAAARPRRGQK